MFELSNDAKQSYSLVGEEQTPVYIVDDAMAEPHLIEERAHTVSYEQMAEQGYPGKRAILDTEYMERVVHAIVPSLRALYRIPTHLQVHVYQGFYSVIDRPESQLSPFQCIPHIDSTSRYYFAIMQYVGQGDFGGTGFYRHVPTGFENVPVERLERYEHAVQSYLDLHGYPEQRYFKESNQHYTLVGKVDYKPNRLVAYPGSLLHSGLIEPGKDIVREANLPMRSTTNLFIEFK